MAGEGDIDAVAIAAALASSDSASGASQEAENGAFFATQGDETECVYGPFLEGGCKLIPIAPERECTTCQEKGVQRWFHHCCKEEACDEMFKRRDPEQYRAFKNQEIENSNIANPYEIPLFRCPNCHPNFPIGGLKRGDEHDEDDEDDEKVDGEKVDGDDKFDAVNFDDDDDDDDTSFVPVNPICDNILRGFNNKDMSDVAFEVGGEVESAANRRKRNKTAATTLHASHVILRFNAPSLADMCRPGDEAAVPINGVEPKVFKMLLYFCYGGTVSEEELSANAKAIIEAADRFGIVNLKLQAEAALAEKTDITVENMLDNLLYANSKNLALFQEKIMDFVAKHGDKIVGNVSFDDVPSSLMSDLLTAFSQGKKSAGEASQDYLKFMRVADLRKRLYDKGLCIDGSRETMIALLSES